MQFDSHCCLFVLQRKLKPSAHLKNTISLHSSSHTNWNHHVLSQRIVDQHAN